MFYFSLLQLHFRRLNKNLSVTSFRAVQATFFLVTASQVELVYSNVVRRSAGMYSTSSGVILALWQRFFGRRGVMKAGLPNVGPLRLDHVAGAQAVQDTGRHCRYDVDMLYVFLA